MTAGKVLATGQIVWVDIPGEGPHPAVVVLCLDHGASYVLVNSSTSPQDVQPTVTLSDSAAKRCGLDRATKFYCAKGFVWHWRPDGAPDPIGRLVFDQHQTDILRDAIATLKAMSNVSVEIGKLPSHAGLSLKALKELNLILRAEALPVK